MYGFLFILLAVRAGVVRAELVALESSLRRAPVLRRPPHVRHRRRTPAPQHRRRHAHFALAAVAAGDRLQVLVRRSQARAAQLRGDVRPTGNDSDVTPADRARSTHQAAVAGTRTEHATHEGFKRGY